MKTQLSVVGDEVRIDTAVNGYIWTFTNRRSTVGDAANLHAAMKLTENQEAEREREAQARRVDREMANAQERDRLERSNRSLRSLVKRLKGKKEVAK